MDKDVIQEQIAYYRARAQEYDQSLVQNGTPNNQQGNGEFEEAARMLRSRGAFKEVLELACGTGIWTRLLLEIGQQVTAIDASPEMLELCRQKVGETRIRYQQADVFEWEPDQRYDLIFFTHWLSHVPPNSLASFLAKVTRAVRPGGQIFIVDQYAPTPEDEEVAVDEIFARRPLADQRTFTIVKVFYNLDALLLRLQRLGFVVIARKLDTSFFALSGTLKPHLK